MLGRPLSLATVMLLIGCFVAIQARAENLDAGKSPSQIFSGTCSECHKTPRGLLKSVPAGSLPGFLRQHYTTGGQMASVLSAYLISNGAADRHLSGGQPKPGKDAAKPEDAKPADQVDRQGRRLRPAEPPQEAAKPGAEPRRTANPDAARLSPQAERTGRRRLARPGEAPDAAKPADAQAPAPAAIEPGPNGRKSVAGRRRGRPASEELPKTDAAKTDDANPDAAKTDTAKTDAAKIDAAKTDGAKEEPSKAEPARDDKPSGETAKGQDNKREDSQPEATKPEGVKPPGEAKAEVAKPDAPKPTGGGEPPVLRSDPVPPVTPAPPSPQSAPTAAANVAPERAPAPPVPAAVPSTLPPGVTASAPPEGPPARTGPPEPPISQ
jgi:hypothetical protein